MSRGVLYVATGEKFTKEALLSAKTVASSMDVDICIATDVDIENSIFDRRINIQDPLYGFGDQIDAMRRTPYEKTLYLDSDIYVTEDISDLFDLLDRFDLAASHAPWRSDGDNSIKNRVPPSFPEHNSGVVPYKLTDDVRSFIDQWEVEYEADVDEGQSRNQPSFRRALFESDISLATLPPEYNFRYQYPGQVSAPVKVLHGRLVPLGTGFDGVPHIMDIHEIEEKINSKSGPRVHYPKRDTISVKSLSDAVVYRAIKSMKEDGVSTTLGKVSERLPGL